VFVDCRWNSTMMKCLFRVFRHLLQLVVLFVGRDCPRTIPYVRNSRSLLPRVEISRSKICIAFARIMIVGISTAGCSRDRNGILTAETSTLLGIVAAAAASRMPFGRVVCECVVEDCRRA
jgi:hypothetical protein